MKRIHAGGKKTIVYLLLILALAFALRAWKLNHQSFWIDEMNTMNECSPSLSWPDFFTMLLRFDPHPPLYFVLMRLLFTVFGHGEFVARFFSACLGTLSVGLMFLLGREIRDRQLGLIAALLTAVNYFNLYYSQEARDYMLAFVLAGLSFLLLLKLIKKRSWPLTFGYGAATAAMICTHYFCLFVLAAQLVLMAMVLYERPAERRSCLRHFAAAGLVIGLGSLPCLPFFLAAAHIKSFWIVSVPPAFPTDFFVSFFGNSFLLQPLLILLLAFFALQALAGKEEHEELSLPFVFTLLFLWVAVSLFLPFVRSLLAFPFITDRYGIVVLPAYLLAVAYGLRLVRPPAVKTLLASALVIFSLNHVVLFREFYHSVYKTQLREVSEFVVSNNPAQHPLLIETTHWHQQYYLRKLGSRAKVLSGTKIDLVNSLLAKHGRLRRTPAFWFIGAHLEQPLDPVMQRKLDFFYRQRAEERFFDAWAQFYQVREGKKSARLLSGADFLPSSLWQADDSGAITLLSGEMRARPLSLPPGRYEAAVLACGGARNGEFARLQLEVDGRAIGEFTVAAQPDYYVFPFRMAAAREAAVAIRLLNAPAATIELLALYPAVSE